MHSRQVHSLSDEDTIDTRSNGTIDENNYNMNMNTNNIFNNNVNIHNKINKSFHSAKRHSNRDEQQEINEMKETKEIICNNNNENDKDKENKENNNDNDEYTDDEEGEEEEDDDLTLSFCKGLNKKPLAVPMVADTNQNSVTRNDAKIITESRLKRLKELSQRPEDELSRDQKNEKKRIIRLEKNRRAAAMSRRKKKMYVKNLEERNELMTKHLALLEMENAHLRAILNITHNAHSQPQPPMIPSYIHSHSHSHSHSHTPHSSSISTKSSNNNSSSSNLNTNMNTIEVSIEPAMKKRKLNNGKSVLSSINSESCSTDLSNMSNMQSLPYPMTLPDLNHLPLPLPLPQLPQFILPPPPNVTSQNVPLPPHIIPPNIPHLIPPNIQSSHNNNKRSSGGEFPGLLPKIGKIDLTKTSDHNEDIVNVENENLSDNKEESNDYTLPPEIIVPYNDLNGILDDDDYVFDSIQECGDIMDADSQNQNVYV